jgi:hypothetical protein
MNEAIAFGLQATENSGFTKTNGLLRAWIFHNLSAVEAKQQPITLTIQICFYTVLISNKGSKSPSLKAFAGTAPPVTSEI